MVPSKAFFFFFSIFMKNAIGILIGIALDMLIVWGGMGILILVTVICEHELTFHNFVFCFSFFHRCLIVFSAQVF